MGLLHKLRKKIISRFKVMPVSCSYNIFVFIAVGYYFSEMRVYMLIILNVIFMIAGRYKNRIQIYHFYAKVMKIIQLIHNALQVSAIKVPYIALLWKGIPFIYMPNLFSEIFVFIIYDVICFVAVKKSVHKNLISYGALCPVRCFIVSVDCKVKEFIVLFSKTFGIIKIYF